MAELLIDTDDVSVFFSPGAGDTCMFVMGHMLKHTRSQYWGQIPIEKLGLPCIGVAAKRAHWYPPSAMDGLIPEIRTYLAPYKQRMGYGFSMGGFGILAYADALNLTHAIPFSPQWSIDPGLVGSFDKRYEEFFRYENSHQFITAPVNTKTAIVYDPTFAPDAMAARKIDPTGRTSHVHMAGIGHATIEPLVSTDRLGALLGATIPEVRTLVRRWKKDHPNYLIWLATKLHRSGRAHLAAKLAAQALEKDPNHQLAQRLKANLGSFF